LIAAIGAKTKGVTASTTVTGAKRLGGQLRIDVLEVARALWLESHLLRATYAVVLEAPTADQTP
jgi:hypothetical protein